MLVPGPLVLLRVQELHFPGDENKAHESAQCLTRDCRDGCSGDAPAEDGDAEEVEKDVERCRDREENERLPAVADRPEERCLHIIEERERQTEENDEQVGDCIFLNVCGGLQNFYDLRAEKRCGHCQYRGAENGQHDHMVDVPAHVLHFRGAEPLRDRDRETVAGAAAEAEHHELDAGRRADGGERIRTEKPPDDDGVDHIVGLLDELSQKDRNHKLKNEAKRTSFCHAADGT